MACRTPLAIQVSIVLRRSSSRATKAEVHYRPAYDDAERVEIPGYPGRYYWKVAYEIPAGQPSDPGDTTVRRAVTSHPAECGTCVHFDLNTCSIVAGTIDPEMVCDLWRGER